MAEPAPQLLTPAEAGARLGVSRQVIHRLIADGELKSVSVGTKPNYPRLRISEDDLKAFIAARTQEAS